jgi:hypothetical protein
MLTKHEWKQNKYQKVPFIGLSNETVIKRFKDLGEYFKYCVVEKDLPLKLEKIKKYMKLGKRKAEVRLLSKTMKWELTLTPEEIHFVVNLDYFEPDFWACLSENQKRFLDIFIFMCLQGTAPVDTKEIHKQDIRNGKIVKERSKSGNDFKVRLHPVSEEILIKNNYNLDFTDATLNEGLKKLFVTIFQLYAKHFEKQNDEPYNLIYTQVIKSGGKALYTIQHKGFFVELMTGRRSFITNKVERASEQGIRKAMQEAGHVIIATTLGYVQDRQRGKNADPNFEPYKIKKETKEETSLMMLGKG